MQDQPKPYPQREAPLFADRRSVRPQVLRTVARSQRGVSSYFETGEIDGEEGEGLPLPLSAALLARGQERFNVYCTPCHSRVGNGRGMIVQRGYYPAGNLHSERLRQAPLGHFFKVMTEGYGAMPTYRAELPPEERWAVAAYIRALQLSQNAKAGDVPPGTRVATLQEIAEREGMIPGFADVRLWDSATVLPASGVRVAMSHGTAESGAAGSAAPAVKSAGDATAGLQVYFNNCLICHQATRTGMPPRIPSLVGIVPRVGEAHIRDVVGKGISTGQPPMPAFGRLSSKDLDNLIEFLKSAK